jgi:hypothetical protein
VTTICIADGEVAADTQLTGNGRTVRIQKVFRMPDGGVVTAAGVWATAYVFIRWLLDGQKNDPPDMGEAEVVIVRPDKSIEIANGYWPAHPILGTEYVVGSGSDVARYARSLGKSPKECVQAALSSDLYSSAPVQVMRVVPKPKHPKAQTFRK